MKQLSLQPDPHMAWIYDPNHPDYHSDKARDLRERRRAALAAMPQVMKDQAAFNDAISEKSTAGSVGVSDV